MKVLKEGRGIRAVNTLPSTFKGWAEAGPGPYYKLDLELAKKKIAEAKKELAAKGLLENGEIPELTIDIGSRDAMGVTQAELFKQQFAKVGVRLKTVLNDWSTQQSKVNNKQSQMYTMGWHADYPDAENFLQLYYTGNIEKQTNNSNYSNPVYDKLYEKVRVMPDTEERTKLYAQMTRIISEDCPHLLLDEPDRFVLYYDWYHNVNPHPVAYGFGKYRRIDPDRRRELGGKEK
jgi:ABC-type transport system substrate-binding protein